MDGIIERLEQKMASFGKSQRKVANYIILEPIKSAFHTIDKLAHASGVSTATVVRLAQSLGYDNYSTFQKELQQYVQAKSSPLEKITLVDMEGPIGDVPAGQKHSVFREVTDVTMDNLQKTLNGLSEETISGVAEKIIAARHVYVVGQRGTEHLAVYLAYHLDRMFTKIDFLPSESAKMPEILPRIEHTDLFIISTVYRYSAQATLVAQLAKKRGATIVTITDSYNSPLSPYSDYQLIIYCKSRDFHNSGTAMIYLADILIDTCYLKAKDEVRKKLKDAEPFVLALKIKTS